MKIGWLLVLFVSGSLPDAALADGGAAPPNSASWSDTSGVVAGVVLSVLDSQPIPFALVRVVGRVSEARADGGGRFSLSLPPGTYDLEARALGYAPQRVSGIAVADGDTAAVGIFMIPAAVRLSDIVVTPSTFGILGEREVVTDVVLNREQIETRPHLGEDIYRAVDRLPGVSKHDITARFQVRGAPSNQVLNLLDGLELYDAFHLKDAEGVFSIIDVESVADVNLVTGGFSAEYGDRLAGVLSMRTPTPDPERSTTTLGLSLQNLTFKSEGGFANGRGTWLASARRGWLDIILSITDATSRETHVSPTYYDVFGKVQYQLGTGHLLSAHVLHAGDRVSSVEDDDTELESDWGSSYAWLNWQAEFSSAISALTSASVGRLRRERLGREFGGERTYQNLRVDDRGTFDFVGLKQDWTLLASDRLMVRWGFDVRHGSAAYDYSRWRLDFVPNTVDPLGPAFTPVVDSLAVVANPSGTQAAFYVSNRLRLGERLTTEVGVRYDRQSHTGDNTVSPRIGAALQLGPRTVLRGAWGLYHQSFDLQDLNVMDGDDNFYPAQRATHHVLGLEHRFPGGASVRVEAYQRLVRNPWPEYRSLEAEIEEVPEEGPRDRVRVDPTRHASRGIEVFVRREGVGRFAWSASYALAEAVDEIGGAWLPRPFDQRHTLSVEFAYRPSARWSLSWAWQYHSPWPATALAPTVGTTADGTSFINWTFGPLYADRLPAYHRLDARVVRHFPAGRGRLSVFLDVYNVYDRENALAFDYRNVELVNNPGRAPAVVLNRGVHPLVPVLPTLGARWEF